MYKEYAVYQPLQRSGAINADTIEKLKTSSYFTSNSSVFNETEFKTLKEMNPRSTADEKKYQKYIAGQQFINGCLDALSSNVSDKLYKDYANFEKALKDAISKVEGYCKQAYFYCNDNERD